MAITKERVDEIIESVFEGKSLKRIMISSGERASFYKYLNENPSTLDLYTRAQQTRAEISADEIIEIADTDLDPQRARNRIDARKWYASKMQPQKYGERIDMNVNQTIDITAALAAANSRVLPGRYLSDIEDAQLVETKQITSNNAADSESVELNNPQLNQASTQKKIAELFE